MLTVCAVTTAFCPVRDSVSSRAVVRRFLVDPDLKSKRFEILITEKLTWTHSRAVVRQFFRWSRSKIKKFETLITEKMTYNIVGDSVDHTRFWSAADSQILRLLESAALQNWIRPLHKTTSTHSNVRNPITATHQQAFSYGLLCCANNTLLGNQNHRIDGNKGEYGG